MDPFDYKVSTFYVKYYILNLGVLKKLGICILILRTAIKNK